MKTKTRAKQRKIQEKWHKSQIKIDRDLRDIIHGYIMSDGHVSKKNHFQVEQGIKQKKFVFWLYQKLNPLCTTTMKVTKRTRNHSKTKRTHSSYRFTTRRFLDGFRAMWYQPESDQNGKYQKKLPNSIDCFFNETFISLWFAGDGTKTIGYRGAKFEVTAFTVADRLKLKALFLQKFDIQTKIISSGKSTKGNPQWALVIPANEYPKFRRLITQIDLIPTLFPYKLHKQ